MKSTAHEFQDSARAALRNPQLARAMAKAKTGFIDRRRAAVEALPGFQSLRRTARDIKEHTLQHLDHYLERFESRVREHGGHVHWASSPAEAREIVIGICRAAGAKRVTKGKSMVSEEIALNDALEAAGLEAIETDLGEYIIQLADEPPSHIIAPAIHRPRTTSPTSSTPSTRSTDSPGVRPRRPRSSARRARFCARSSRPPTSASPARTSSSRRPGRASSSPTKATATSPTRCPACTS